MLNYGGFNNLNLIINKIVFHSLLITPSLPMNTHAHHPFPPLSCLTLAPQVLANLSFPVILSGPLAPKAVSMSYYKAVACVSLLYYAFFKVFYWT